MRGLAEGSEGYKEFPKLLRENFVFLNVYCTSIKDEEDPRGPEGPFRFKERSVPVYVIKSFEGETYKQQLGFVSDKKQGLKQIADDLQKALQRNGPVMPPKLLRPLVKNFEKGEEHLAKDRPGYAFVEFEKVVKAGEDQKRFPKGPPLVAQRAAERLETILEEARKLLDEAAAQEDPKEREKLVRRILRSHGKIPEIADRGRALLKGD